MLRFGIIDRVRGIADSFIDSAKEKSPELSSLAVILDFFSRLVCPVSAESVAINRRSKTHDAVNSDDSHACEET
jgi:hypothetical protein